LRPVRRRERPATGRAQREGGDARAGGHDVAEQRDVDERRERVRAPGAEEIGRQDGERGEPDPGQGAPAPLVRATTRRVGGEGQGQEGGTGEAQGGELRDQRRAQAVGGRGYHAEGEAGHEARGPEGAARAPVGGAREDEGAEQQEPEAQPGVEQVGHGEGHQVQAEDERPAPRAHEEDGAARPTWPPADDHIPRPHPGGNGRAVRRDPDDPLTPRRVASRARVRSRAPGAHRAA